ncbi:retropepsin-like aspartic protease [Cochleicola gelatinilyticus]|uniref:Acid protease n=1 Tax=Cochleicola gelatinilyticus TaxID=1763537 RepID=A0A167JAJ0_9FLAO|nr:retropepsin-like aspartic protease [Cochleicola gelatinilyticus]OAB80486.1 acid protease [Cochleicola gelatinilyticus]
MQLRQFLEAQQYHRIPLKKLATGHYKLTAMLNGMSGNFILDTGASTSCIGFESATYFLMNSEESDIKAAGAGAINMETRASRNNTITLEALTINRQDFVLFDLSHVNEALLQVNETKVHGIIGADLLKKRRAVIDYGRNCLYLK